VAADCRLEPGTAAALEKAGAKRAAKIGRACGGEDRACGGDLTGERSAAVPSAGPRAAKMSTLQDGLQAHPLAFRNEGYCAL